MIKHILVGYDGSKSSDNALTFAITLARTFNASVHVLAVMRPPEFGGTVESEALIEQGKKHYEQLLHNTRARLAQSSLQTHFHVAIGHPAEQIVRYAEAHHIDHIVVGHRGHTLFERWLIGSVARQVIAYAHCAVTVIR